MTQWDTDICLNFVTVSQFFQHILIVSPISSKTSNVHYIDRNGTEDYMTTDTFPQPMEKKMKLIIYFKRYMSEHLVKAGGDSARGVGDPFSRIPHLHTWFRTTCAVVMHLTNGSVQVGNINRNDNFVKNDNISVKIGHKLSQIFRNCSKVSKIVPKCPKNRVNLIFLKFLIPSAKFHGPLQNNPVSAHERRHHDRQRQQFAHIQILVNRPKRLHRESVPKTALRPWEAEAAAW